MVCSPGRTKLDRERTSQCLAEIVKLYKWLQFNANFTFLGKHREYSEALAGSDLRREYPGKIPRCNDTSGEA